MDRRTFFRHAFSRTAEEAIKLIDEKVTDSAIHWIRPPYALGEPDFLRRCTRCDACIEACPHDVIFPLATHLGTKVAKTPALDLLNKGCHLCADWPCVNVCEQDALAFPVLEQEEGETEMNANATPIPLPKLASVSINTKACFPYNGPECGACNWCPVEGALVWDQQRPSINGDKCVGCGMCREFCIVEPKAVDLVQIVVNAC